MAVIVDEYGAMHLAAGRNAGNPFSSTRDFFKDASNTENRTFPPRSGALLGPPEPRNDLIVFPRGVGDYFSIPGEDCRAHTAGANVDRKQKVVLHELGRSWYVPSGASLLNSQI
jgi:hypothetical protein